MSVVEDLRILAELKEKLNPERMVQIPASVLENVCMYCENYAIYDKLSNYGDFYYKIKKLLTSS